MTVGELLDMALSRDGMRLPKRNDPNELYEHCLLHVTDWTIAGLEIISNRRVDFKSTSGGWELHGVRKPKT